MAPFLDLSDAKILGGKCFLCFNSKHIFLVNLSNGSLLATVEHSLEEVKWPFEIVDYMAVGEEDKDILCFVWAQKKLFKFCSGKLFPPSMLA